MNDSPVAVIGLGLMGEVYARRLLDARIPVIGYDIDPSKRDRLAAIGGRSVDGIAKLAKRRSDSVCRSGTRRFQRIARESSYELGRAGPWR